MFKKKKGILIGVLCFCILIIVIVSCQKEDQTVETSGKNVTVQKVAGETYEAGLDYIGVVQPKETKNYAFLTGGKLEEIYVEKGQEINSGDMLAKLDTSSLKLNGDIARSNVNNLGASVSAAKVGLTTLKSSLDAMKTLYEEGALSEKEYEALAAEYKARQAEYENLLGNYTIAQDTLKQVQISINDAVLYADSEGYIMEIPYKQGEVVGAGYPVVISKSGDLVVTVGISIGDYNKISTLSRVVINGEIDGSIDSIAPYPDEQTRVYAVDILFNTDKITVGETVDVKIFTGEKMGSFIPIECVFQLDGIDYVYVIDENNKVSRQQVILGEARGNSVRVENLDSETMVVTSGIKSLKENDMVTIVEQEGTQI